MRADTLEKVRMAMQGPRICSTLDCELEEEAPAQQSSECACWLCPEGHDGTVSWGDSLVHWQPSPAAPHCSVPDPSGCEDNSDYFSAVAERSRVRELGL